MSNEGREAARARLLAERILDRFHGDPDDDLAILARAVVRLSAASADLDRLLAVERAARALMAPDLDAKGRRYAVGSTDPDFAALRAALRASAEAAPGPDVERLAHKAAEIAYTYGALGRDFEYAFKNVNDMLAAEAAAAPEEDK